MTGIEMTGTGSTDSGMTGAGSTGSGVAGANLTGSGITETSLTGSVMTGADFGTGLTALLLDLRLNVGVSRGSCT